MKTPLLRSFTILMAIFSAMVGLNGCGSSSESNTTTTTTTSNDWSALGAKTKGDGSGPAAVSHSEYLTDSHSALTCTNCHSAAKTSAATGQPLNAVREAICVSCHPFSNYTMTYVNHDTYKTGSQCNKCHYSNTGITGYSGWRLPNTTGTSTPTKRTRIDHANWHTAVGGSSGSSVVCLDCHRTADISTFPTSTHGAGSGRTTGCQTCHYYSSGKWGGAHAAVTTGCTSCHSKHYSGYQCEWCHTTVATGGFKSWSLSFSEKGHQSWDSRSCAACHGAGGFND